MPQLTITTTAGRYTAALPDTPGTELLVGSSPRCHVRVPSLPGFEGEHARITCISPQQYMITNLGTKAGGTQANGLMLQAPTLLMPGVEYRMGELSMQLTDNQMPAQAPIVLQPMYIPIPSGAAAEESTGRRIGGQKLSRKEKRHLSGLTRERARALKVLVPLGLLLIAFLAGWLPVKPEQVIRFFTETMPQAGDDLKELIDRQQEKLPPETKAL